MSARTRTPASWALGRPARRRVRGVRRVRTGQQALDVGCGPGALTALLVERLGADAVSAVDPSASFRRGHPLSPPRGGRAHRGGRGPAVRRRQRRRRAGPAGRALHGRPCGRAHRDAPGDPARRRGRGQVWDHAGLTGPLATFWQAVRELDPSAPGEADLAGTREGHLVELAVAAGLAARRGHPAHRPGRRSRRTTTGGRRTRLGSARPGPYVAGLDDAHRAALRERCAALLPGGAVHDVRLRMDRPRPRLTPEAARLGWWHARAPHPQARHRRGARRPAAARSRTSRSTPR